MAFPATIYGAEKDVYETGAVQLYPLGQKLVTPSGSIFRYGLMGAVAGVAASLYQSAVPTTGHQSQAVVTTALAVGDTTINFRPTTTALAANELAGGTVLVEETDDLGHIYPVKSNTAAANDADSTLTLADGVTVQVAVAIAGGNVLTVMKSPWRNVVIHASPPTALPCGIPRIVIAAAAFGWIQTRGVSSYLVSGVHLIGQPLAPSNAIDGSLGMKRKSGTGTIANAATTAVITHDLGSTPTLDNISIIMGENPTNAIDAFWVDTITATQFTINSNDPGASALDLAWAAEINLPVVGFCMEVAPTADFGHCFLTLE